MARQFFDRIDEFQALEIHHETDRRTVRPATEAVIELLLRTDGEGRSFFAVERAAGLELFACALQRNAMPDQFNDIDAAEQLFDKGFGDQAAHAANPRSKQARPWPWVTWRPMRWDPRVLDVQGWRISGAESGLDGEAYGFHVGAALYLSAQGIHHDAHVADAARAKLLNR